MAGVARDAGRWGRAMSSAVLPPPRGTGHSPRPSQRQRAFADRTRRRVRRRRVANTVMVVVLSAAAVAATLPLIFILWHLVREGAAALSLDFFTQMPRPVGEAGGGLANAIVGTLILLGIATAIGLPVGVGAGLYLAEYRRSPLATIVRFLSDVLNGLPSIVMGIFGLQFLVRS